VTTGLQIIVVTGSDIMMKSSCLWESLRMINGQVKNSLSIPVST